MRIRTPAVVVTLVLVTTGLAWALPGQQLNAVCAWAKASPDLAQVNCDTGGSEGDDSFILARVLKPDVAIAGRLPEDNLLTFEAHPDGRGEIAIELVKYHHLPDVPDMTFDRNGGKGLDVVRTLYGDAIADDFVRAKRTRITPNENDYKGRLFAYVTMSMRVNNPGADIAHATTIDDIFMLRPR
jgi:hypothetical protein